MRLDDCSFVSSSNQGIKFVLRSTYMTPPCNDDGRSRSSPIKYATQQPRKFPAAKLSSVDPITTTINHRSAIVFRQPAEGQRGNVTSVLNEEGKVRIQTAMVHITSRWHSRCLRLRKNIRRKSPRQKTKCTPPPPTFPMVSGGVKLILGTMGCFDFYGLVL